MTTSNLTDVQARIEQHLIEKRQDGDQYFKSKYIADELDLSAKRVGTNLKTVKENSTRINVEDWGGSPSKTYKVEVLAPQEPGHSEQPANISAVSDD